MYLPYLMCGFAATIILMLAGCYVISRTMPGLRGLRQMIFALFWGLFAVILFAARPVAPAWASVLLANECLFVCSFLLYIATTEILCVRASFVPWGWSVLVASFVPLFCFTYIHDEVTARIYVCSGALAVYAAARAKALMEYREPDPVQGIPVSALRSLVMALIWLQVVIVALQFARILLTALYPPHDVVHLDVIQSGFSYLNLVLNAGAGFGLTWLVLSMHRRDLHRTAHTDSLTGLLNRRAFEEILVRELDRANRAEKSLAILMIDIDRFKQVNDTWGHQTGDEVLRRVAWTLRNCLRPGDVVARFGGEEFVILPRGADAEQPEEIAGRLRAKVAGVADLPEDIRLTVSIGVAASQRHDSARELLRRCDEAMYRSKRAGRNLVTVDESLPGAAPAAAEA